MDVNPAVLYVEDDANSRRVMDMVLSRKMKLSNVTYFEDSQDFLAKVIALDPRPDVVFLDIHVQPHTGFEMLKMLRRLQQFNDVPVVALTASVMNEEVAELQQVGFDSCLSKPIDARAFPTIFQRILNHEHVWRITA